MTISDIKVKDNPERVTSTVKLLHNDSSRQFALNMDFDVKKEVRNVKVKAKVQITMQFMENQQFNQIIDICSFLQNTGKSWQMKFIFGNLDQYPNIPKGCPISPGKYLLHNTTSDLNSIPMKIIPEVKFLATFDVFTLVKKRPVPIFLMQFEGALKHNSLL